MVLREAYELFVREKRIDGVSPRTLGFYAWALGPAVREGSNRPVESIETLLWADLDARREMVNSVSLHSAFRAWRTFVLLGEVVARS